MNGILFWLSILVAVLFLAAAGLKLSQPKLFVSEVKDFDLFPPAIVGPIAGAVIALEIGGGILALTPGYHQLGCAVLVALLLIFSIVAVHALLSGRRQLSCACFGSASRTLSWGTPLRNFLLGTAAAAGILAEPTSITAASASATLLSASIAFLWLQAAEMFSVVSEEANV